MKSIVDALYRIALSILSSLDKYFKSNSCSSLALRSRILLEFSTVKIYCTLLPIIWLSSRIVYIQTRALFFSHTNTNSHTVFLLFFRWKNGKQITEDAKYIYLDIFMVQHIFVAFCFAFVRYWINNQEFEIFHRLLVFFTVSFHLNAAQCSDVSDQVPFSLLKKFESLRFYALLLLACLLDCSENWLFPDSRLFFLRFFLQEQEVRPFIENLFIHKLFEEKKNGMLKLLATRTPCTIESIHKF